MTTSKTEDIEFEIMLFLDGGARSLDEIMQRLSWVDDTRWIGVAIDLHLVEDGRARYADCDVNHDHSGDCRLEAVTAWPELIPGICRAHPDSDGAAITVTSVEPTGDREVTS